MALAASPDSSAPISLDDPMNIPLIADMRPRIWSGVVSWRMVERITTETPSHAPDSISHSAADQKPPLSPKATMHTPNPPTEPSR